MPELEIDRDYWREQAVTLLKLTDADAEVVDSLGRICTVDDIVDHWLASPGYLDWLAEHGHPIDKLKLN